MLQAALSGAFRDTSAVLRLVLLGVPWLSKRANLLGSFSHVADVLTRVAEAGLNAVLTPLCVAGLHAGTAGRLGRFLTLPNSRWKDGEVCAC